MGHMESRGTPVQVYISHFEKLMLAVLCIQEGRRKEVAATLLQETWHLEFYQWGWRERARLETRSGSRVEGT